MATAGKVAPTPKDKFVNGTAYDKLDVVEYNGTLYIAKKASAGVLPTDTEYWMLAVDLTGKLDTTGDTENNTVTFTSGDATDPTAWKNVATLSSKEKHSSLLNKISTMFSNVRYLYKLLGTTDISSLGTVTQALANLDGNVGDIKGIISSLADCSAATVAGYAADALAVKELNSYLSIPVINDVDTTIEAIILQRFCGRIFSFQRTHPTSDAPYNESWTYIYIVIPIEGSIHMVVAYKSYSSNAIYQRTIDSNGWNGGWYQFGGTLMS